MVLKTGRFCEFTACTNYPTCKYLKQKTIGVPCPNCSQGEIVEQRSKRGKMFYGCSRYTELRLRRLGQASERKVSRLRRQRPGRKVTQALGGVASARTRVQV
jgi:ssDNA-binding Zn-finger/Zn-ribbon topoisomerase 1